MTFSTNWCYKPCNFEWLLRLEICIAPNAGGVSKSQNELEPKTLVGGQWFRPLLSSPLSFFWIPIEFKIRGHYDDSTGD
jgi:hypothetical protein